LFRFAPSLCRGVSAGITLEGMSPVDEIARQVNQRVRNALGSDVVPLHLIRRLAYLLADQQIVYVDSHFAEGAAGLRARVVVFSDSVVAIGDTAWIEPPGHPNDSTVTVVARSSLQRLDIAPVEGEEMNRDGDWTPPSFPDSTWPLRGATVLTYRELEEPLIVPRAGAFGREDFMAFLPSLLEDLA
jgi:hypothetical protein